MPQASDTITHHFEGFSMALSVLIDDEGDVDGWGERLEDDFARLPPSRSHEYNR